PGETIHAIVEYQGLEEQPFTRSYPITIPDNTAEGDQQIVIGDAATYTQLSLAARPYLGPIDSVTDMVKVYHEMITTDPRQRYVGITATRTGLALAGQGLDQLPASRAIALAGNSTTAVPYQSPAVKQFDAERLIVGGGQVKLTIRR